MDRPLSSFPQDVLNVLELLAGSLKGVIVYGSASSARLYWPGDVDALRNVPTAQQPALVKQRVAACLKTPMLWLCDIKCGADPADKSGAARWTVQDVLEGRTRINNGKDELTLEDACAQTNALCKLDAVAFLPSVQEFREFSMVFRNGGFVEDAASLQKDIAELEKEGRWLKVCKRARSLAVLQGDAERADALVAILNSPAGQAGQIAGDLACIETLSEFTDQIPEDKVKQELDLIKFRASGVYGLGLKKEHVVAQLCDKAQSVPSTRASIPALLRIVTKIYGITSVFANDSAHEQLLAIS